MARIIVIAGVATGVGKTSITLGLLDALRRRGLRIQAFKVGPDFIDPGFHALATGRPSYTLDGWMCGRDAVLACVARQSQDAHLAVVEGVMGCFDGIDGRGEGGSTAEIAKWLGTPVVLVVDAWASARSAAAVVRGFEDFDPALDLAGVIVNRVGGEAHGRTVLDAIADTGRATPLGAVARDETLTLPERHLGLVTAAEGVLDAEKLRRLGDAVDRSVDLNRLLSLAREVPPFEAPGRGALPGECRSEQREGAPSRRVRIGVARDAAFQFYYAENLDLLREAGAVARGHEFHYSALDPVPDGVERVYRIVQRGGPARAEGYRVGRTLMSYIHLHFASNPELPRAFVRACAGSRA